MFKKVLLCYDATEMGRSALRQGAELAILVGAQIHVLSIIPDGIPNSILAAGSAGYVCLVDDAKDVGRLLDEAIVWLQTRGVFAQGHLTRGNTLDQIVGHAKKLAVDLIVVGHYPRTSGGRWWSGPEQKSLAEQVNCSVFIAVGK